MYISYELDDDGYTCKINGFIDISLHDVLHQARVMARVGKTLNLKRLTQLGGCAFIIKITTE